MPGGGLEPGESHVDALHRELEEEVGLVDTVDDPILRNLAISDARENIAQIDQHGRALVRRTEEFDLFELGLQRSEEGEKGRMIATNNFFNTAGLLLASGTLSFGMGA